MIFGMVALLFHPVCPVYKISENQVFFRVTLMNVIIIVGDAHWTDLATETNDLIVDGGSYKFGARVPGSLPNEWDPTAYTISFESNLQATFTYTMDGCSLDEIAPR